MVLATGYNGSPPGMPHCPEDEDLAREVHCSRSIHAEQNVIGHAARSGRALAGATWYLTPFGPCHTCALLLATTQPARVVFPRSGLFEFPRVLADSGVEIEVLDD